VKQPYPLPVLTGKNNSSGNLEARRTAELPKENMRGTKLDKLIWANVEVIGYGG
jgi:hypothetical protein